MTKRALITGVLGQDGAHLSKLLLEIGYEVYGTYRRSSSLNTWRLRELGIQDRVRLVPMELLEYSNVRSTIDAVRPTEVYNLAAQSYVGSSFDTPLYTGDVDALGAVRVLEAVRATDRSIRVYQASTSEMFGDTWESPQSERTPFRPRSPYGAAKMYAHAMAVNYRDAFDMYVCSGILFNHEGPFRGQDFITRKSTAALARIRFGHQEELVVGHLDARRDWGYAGDYVLGMWQMLNAPHPADYVMATGQQYSVRSFITVAARCAGFDINWTGNGADAVARDLHTGKIIVRVDRSLYRPTDVNQLRGDASLIRTRLGWRPETNFQALVEMMMEADLCRAAAGASFT